MYKVIYVFKISKAGPFVPPSMKATSLTFVWSLSGQDDKPQFKYLPLGKDSPEDKYLSEGNPEILTLDSTNQTQHFPPLPKGTIEQILDYYFSSLDGTAFIETEEVPPSPLVLVPSYTRKIPDYMATLRSDPRIEIAPSGCETSLIPWRYRLPLISEGGGSSIDSSHSGWIEVDALGVKDMGFMEDLEDYFRKSKGGRSII